MLHLVQKDGLHLRHASERIRDIHTIVFAAVQTTGLALRFASTALQKDAKIVCAAVSTDGMALQYVIGGCHGAVEAALRENGAAVQFVEEVTKEMAVLAVTHTCTALGYVGDVFCDDEDMVVAAVSQCGALLHLASKRLQACESVVCAAVVKGGGCGAGGHPDVVEQVGQGVRGSGGQGRASRSLAFLPCLVTESRICRGQPFLPLTCGPSTRRLQASYNSSGPMCCC